MDWEGNCSDEEYSSLQLVRCSYGTRTLLSILLRQRTIIRLMPRRKYCSELEECVGSQPPQALGNFA